MFTQGYIGISKNLKRRFRAHETKTENKHLKQAINKYGWDNLVKEVILIADKAYCLMIELQLRSSIKIGWNIAKGGGIPPHINIWNKNRPIPKDELIKMKANGFGFKKGFIPWNTGIKYTEEMVSKIYDIASYTRGKPAHNKGKPMPLEQKQKLLKKVKCLHCDVVGYSGNIARYHMDNCKNKGEIF